MIFMNVKNSRSMNKTLKITVAAALLFWSAGLFAQTFDIVERRDFWNAGRNVNGLRTDSLTVSYAELGADYTSGGLRDVNDPKTIWSAGAEAGTITHLKKFSMIGAFSFRNAESQKLCGSMSARPGYYPVDIYEFTPGRKTRQTYSFLGGIAVDLNDSWRLGGKLDFAAENYTKRKDLRHTNFLLDMTFAPSIMWHRGDLALGASYVFSKTSETITAEELGITSGVYYAFIDKGLMYGVQDIWDNSGLHIEEAGVIGFPSRELTNGGAAQIQWRNFYAEIEALASHGSTGEKQKIWYNFDGWSMGVKMDYRIPGNGHSHYLRGRYSIRTQDNDENVLEDVTENGVTTTRKYGTNNIFTRQSINAGAEWELLLDSGEYFNAGLGWTQDREVSTMTYPFVNTCKADVFNVFASILVKFGRFDLKVNANVSKGKDDEYHWKSQGIEASDEPFRLSEYEAAMTAYETCAKVNGCLSVRYNFRKGVYLEASYEGISRLKKKFDIVGGFSAGRIRNREALTIGYNF